MASKIKVYEVLMPLDREEASIKLKEEIWPTLRPEWNNHKLVTKSLNDGYVNSMTIHHMEEDGDRKEAVIVRVFKPDLEEWRDLEFVKLQIAEHMGCFPALRAVFRNGVIYDYAPGRCLKAEDQKNPHILSQLARTLAQFHWFTPSATANLVDRKGKRTTFEVKDVFLQCLKKDFNKRIETIPHETEEARQKFESTIREIEKELSFLEEYMDGLDLPVANAHCDFHSNNILYNEDSDRVTLVDFEVSQEGSLAMFDFSSLFNMHHFHGNEEAYKIDLCSEGFSEELKQLMVREYLNRKYELEGRDPKDITDDIMEVWMTHLAIVERIWGLCCAIGCLPFLTTDFEFSVVNSCYMLMDIYRGEKDKLPELREKYIRISQQKQ